MTRYSSTHPTWVQARDAQRRGDLGMATRLYRQIIAEEPQHAEALYHLGCLARAQGQVALARVYLRQAAALQPHAAVHGALGEVAAALGDLATATARMSSYVWVIRCNCRDNSPRPRHVINRCCSGIPPAHGRTPTWGWCCRPRARCRRRSTVFGRC